MGALTDWLSEPDKCKTEGCSNQALRSPQFKGFCGECFEGWYDGRADEAFEQSRERKLFREQERKEK